MSYGKRGGARAGGERWQRERGQEAGTSHRRCRCRRRRRRRRRRRCQAMAAGVERDLRMEARGGRWEEEVGPLAKEAEGACRWSG